MGGIPNLVVESSLGERYHKQDYREIRYLLISYGVIKIWHVRGRGGGVPSSNPKPGSREKCRIKISQTRLFICEVKVGTD